jgi:hypothetical protein
VLYIWYSKIDIGCFVLVQCFYDLLFQQVHHIELLQVNGNTTDLINALKVSVVFIQSTWYIYSIILESFSCSAGLKSYDTICKVDAFNLLGLDTTILLFGQNKIEILSDGC